MRCFALMLVRLAVLSGALVAPLSGAFAVHDHGEGLHAHALLIGDGAGTGLDVQHAAATESLEDAPCHVFVVPASPPMTSVVAVDVPMAPPTLALGPISPVISARTAIPWGASAAAHPSSASPTLPLRL